MSRLTGRTIEALPTPESGQRIYYDDDVKGFGVRVIASGTRSFVLNYYVGGRERRLTIGRYPTWTATAARKEAGRLLRQADTGTDPLAEKQRRHGAGTVKELVTEYIERHAKPKKRSWEADQRILNKEVIPLWGSRKAEDITRREIVELLDKIVDRGSPTMANRTLAVIRKMFNFAVERDILETSPASHVKAPAKETSRERVLTADEIKTVWEALSKPQAGMSDAIRRALKLILVTGQRPGEVIGLRRSEIEGTWWTIPAERAKNGITHRVPLTAMATSIIAECHGDDLLFESPRKGRPIETNAVAYAVRRADFGIDHWTPHDLRRTMATSLGRLGFNRLILSKVLNHKDPTIDAVYDRYAYDTEKRQALNKWARELTRIIEGNGESSNVVEIAGAAQ